MSQVAPRETQTQTEHERKDVDKKLFQTEAFHAAAAEIPPLAALSQLPVERIARTEKDDAAIARAVDAVLHNSMAIS